MLTEKGERKKRNIDLLLDEDSPIKNRDIEIADTYSALDSYNCRII